jgi:glycolate oxidase subunit GlcD
VSGEEDSGRPLPSRILAALEEVVGPAGLVREAGRLMAYESDALPRFRQTPAAVVLPRDTGEAARVVEILVEAGVPLTPRGAGTGLAGGAVAAPGGVVLGTSRMTRILELDPVRRLARVQAGVVNSELSRAAAEFGLHYAPDPSSQAACTLGGNVGENAGGPHCLKYGVTTRYVTGLTVVGGRGEILELGGAGRSEEFDLTGLFVGSEGCFGLATELELRLLPRARGVRTLLAVFPDTETAGQAVSAIIARGLLPAALEMMDRGTIEAVEASVFAAGYPRDAGAVLVVEFDGTEAGLDADAEAAEALCTGSGATLVRRARDEDERAALWQGRKKAYGAFGRITPDLMVQDATVPRSALPGVLRQIEDIGVRHRLRLANVFHAGDGNLHPKILFDRRDPELVERVEAASKAIMQVCVGAGGTITGEHGVGLDKRGYMPLVHGPAELAAMAAVQRAFDPEGRWNPGKVLPDAGRREASTEVPVGPGRGTPRPTAIDHSPEDLTVRVGGEVPMAELEATLALAGQWLPLDVPGQGSFTVADLVAAGEWGPLAPAFGRSRDLVLGALVDTPGRGLLRLGGQVMKNVAGFDLVRTVAGSRGRLGRIVEVVFRLLPIPEIHRVWSWEAAGAEPGAGGDDLHAVAGALAVHPVLPASLVRGWGADGVERVHLRLLGSRATVEAESAELVALQPGAVLWEEAPERPGFVARDPIGRGFGPLAGDDALLEVRGGPLESGQLEARVDRLSLPARWRYHLPAWNVWRLAVPPGPLHDASDHDAAERLRAWVEELRAGGGDAALLRAGGGGVDLGRWASPAVLELERAVIEGVRGGGP